MMEAVELEMIPWLLELRSAEPWLQQQKRLHAMRLGRSPCISLATEDHQLYANWAEMHSVSSPPYVELNEREASQRRVSASIMRRRYLAVRLRLRLGASWFERSSESPEPKYQFQGARKQDTYN